MTWLDSGLVMEANPVARSWVTSLRASSVSRSMAAAGHRHLPRRPARTSVGKLDKKAMRAAYADTYRQAASAEAPAG
jgi:hypothetical protein